MKSNRDKETGLSSLTGGLISGYERAGEQSTSLRVIIRLRLVETLIAAIF